MTEGAQDSLSIILTAYREAENLSILLPRLTAAARALTPTFEVLVVDTMAPMDATEAVCAAHGVRHLRRGPTNDYGDAIRTGIGGSRGAYVVVMDADGSHNPGFLPELWAQRHRAEVVIASRYALGGRTDNPRLLVGLSRVLNQFFRLMAGFPVLDVSNSYRLYRGDLLRGLRLSYRHFDVLEEILARLLWQGPAPARVIEVPYRFERRWAGRSKRNLLMFGLHFLLASARIRSMRRSMSPDRAAAPPGAVPPGAVGPGTRPPG